MRGFNLDVTDGEFIVLVGPSGCGKTTTLRMIAGLEELTEGDIHIGDRLINRVHPKDRDIAMVFQDYALYPHMTVRKNLAFGLKMRKTPKNEIETRVAETALLLGITELLDRKPKALSGGQQQRVALGRAIIRHPKCFLFDEPLSNLDAKLRTHMRAEIKTLHMQFRTTTIYVTHDQEEAMTLGERVVVMAGGEIQQVGAPLDVYRSPINRFVAAFVGTPTMNFLDGRLQRSGAGIEFSDGKSVRIPIRSAGAADLVDRDLVLGVRCEHLRSHPDPAGGDVAINVGITITEPLGDRTDIYARTAGGVTMVARVEDGSRFQSGEPGTFHVNPAAVHLFEPGEFGRRLALD